MRKPSLRGAKQFAQGFTLDMWLTTPGLGLLTPNPKHRALGYTFSGDRLNASFTGLLGAWKGIWWRQHTVGPLHFPQGRQCALLGLEASLSERSKDRGSGIGTVQKQFRVAGDRLEPRGEESGFETEEEKAINWKSMALQANGSYDSEIKMSQGVHGSSRPWKMFFPS